MATTAPRAPEPALTRPTAEIEALRELLAAAEARETAAVRGLQSLRLGLALWWRRACPSWAGAGVVEGPQSLAAGVVGAEQ